MAFRVVTYRGRDAAADDRGFTGMAFRAVTYPPMDCYACRLCFADMAFRALTYLTEASMLGLPILQAPRFEQLLTWLAKSQESIKVLQVWSF